MHEIARRAGVGKATVSLALRDDPRLRPETRRRIQRLAAKMGYRTNATIANLMAQLRASRTPRYQATLALLNVSPDSSALSASSAWRHRVTGCGQRALQLGYGLESFWWHQPGSRPADLASMLDSRNIRGLIIAGLPDRGGLPAGFDAISGRFACVSAGVRPGSPALNFSSNDHFATASQAVQRLGQYGCRRMGLVIDPGVDAGVERRYSAGFLAGQANVEAGGHIPVFAFRPSRETSFRAWVEEHRPDAIISIHEEVKTWIAQMDLKVPEEIALVHLDRDEELPDWSGLDQNNPLIGAAAVDLLVGQLHRNEFGLPEFQKATHVQSTWVDGPTAREAASPKPELETAAA